MNTGKVCIGTIGNEHRMDTTTIGDAVNLASRVASCTKMYHSPVLLSESTRNLFSGSGHIFRVLGPARYFKKYMDEGGVQFVK